MSSDLIILAVINCYKCNWHEVDLNQIKSGLDLFIYFKKYYNSRNMIVDIDLDSKRYNLKTIRSLYKYCEKNPNRICVYIDY